ncbi:MAG: transcriptional repressor [Candidatus Dadabacteria bacterium]|nr:MAG: transcriptional repressor [Candidatus Dadabacteria bacterium]
MGTAPSHRRTLDDFGAACRRVGVAPTQQRRLIYRVLAESEDHPTADEVHRRVRAIAPGVSLATVYRNLRLFARAGLIEEVATGANFARYDANRAAHHHLVCKRCGRVADTSTGGEVGRGAVGRTVDGFEVHDVRVNFVGLCPACRANRS